MFLVQHNNSNKMYMNAVLLLSVLVIILSQEALCLHKRCMRCRSRGELGSCGDPFPFNVTEPDAEVGIHVVACPSGWCGKLSEGNSAAFKADDYGAATERMCLQRAPSDYEERCAYTMWNHRKVYMCFCNGDLCNSAFRTSVSYSISIIAPVMVFLYNLF